MANPTARVRELFQERLDEDLLPALYAACSLPTAKVRRDFHAQGIVYADRSAGLKPSLPELDQGATRVVEASRTRAGVMGAIGGLGGAAGVPPEVLASLVHTLRMGQRLSILYGFDPETDAGRVVMWRALAAAFDVDLPKNAQLSLRVRDLPALAAKQMPGDPQQAATVVAKRVLNLTTQRVLLRGIRLIPGLTSAFAARNAYRRQQVQSERMLAVLRKAFGGSGWRALDISEAEEIPQS
jgi:hypothetical protein